MSYNFKDFGELVNSPERHIPSDDMLINGESLMDIVPYYRQLSVSGRGVVESNVEIIDVPRRDERLLASTRVGERILSIRYQIKARTSEQMREAFTELNKVLRDVNYIDFMEGNMLEITFADEDDVRYYGVLQNASTIDETSKIITSEFMIYCPSPYKYTEEHSDLSLDYPFSNELVPNVIRLTANSVSQIRVESNGKELVLNDNFSTGNVVEINVGNRRTYVTRDGFNITSKLSLNSVPERFTIAKGSLPTVTGATITSIDWRDKKL